MYPIAEFFNPDHFRVESVIACILAEGCLQSFFKSDQLVEGGEVINFAFMGDLVMSIDWFEVYNQGVSIGYVLGVGGAVSMEYHLIHRACSGWFILRSAII